MTSLSTAQAEVVFEKSEYLNFERGLERYAGNEGTYTGILRFYSLIIPALIEAIRGIDYDCLPEMANKFHGLRLAGRSICAKGIESRAEALEKAARSGNTDYINTYCDAFLGDLWYLVFEINEILARKGND